MIRVGRPAQLDAAQVAARAPVAARVPVAMDGGQTHSADLLLGGTDDYARVVYLNGTSPRTSSTTCPPSPRAEPRAEPQR